MGLDHGSEGSYGRDRPKVFIQKNSLNYLYWKAFLFRKYIYSTVPYSAEKKRKFKNVPSVVCGGGQRAACPVLVVFRSGVMRPGVHVVSTRAVELTVALLNDACTSFIHSSHRHPLITPNCAGSAARAPEYCTVSTRA